MSLHPTTTAGMSRADLFFLASDFLSAEAKALDERRLEDWFEMTAETCDYRVPVRQAKKAYDEECPEGAYRIQDDKGLLRIRINRLTGDHCWSETPPSRTLRLVGNVTAAPTEREDVVAVESAVLIYRQRGHEWKGDIIAVRRLDELQLTPEGPKLLKRVALLGDCVLQTPNLGIML